MNKDNFLFFTVAFLIILIAVGIVIITANRKDERIIAMNIRFKKIRLQAKQNEININEATKDNAWWYQVNHGSCDYFLASKVTRSSDFLKNGTFIIPCEEEKDV